MIYDCFTFFNELDLLEIRLKILNDYVDKFVLVEATKTFSGIPKPLYFKEHRHKFSSYLNKIIHIPVDNISESQNAWVIEHFQRNQIYQGLKGCTPDDIILISDLDEIPNPDAIKGYIQGSGINVLIQSMYYYFFNYRCATVNKWIPWRKDTKWFQWDAARICQFKDIKCDIDTIRNGLNYKILCARIMNGGWHFSYTGGIEKIIEKIESFSHQEYNSDYFKDKSRLIKCIEENEDLYNRKYKYFKVPIDEHYPKYIQDNIPLLREKGLIL